jgi:type II secretory pathway component PulF
MSQFSYKAVAKDGRLTQGRMDGPDQRAIALRIQGMGLIPIAIEQSAAKTPRGRPLFQNVSQKDVLFFTEELATLVNAGLPLDRSLGITAELASKPALRIVIQDVLKQIKGGKSLAESLAAHPKHFSRLYVNMIRAGEAGGVLDKILNRLADFQRNADELRSYLVSALIYPALLSAVGIGSIVILMFFVIPRFSTIFTDIGAPIPFSTQVLLTLSDWMLRYWSIGLLIVAAVVFGVRSWLKTPAGSHQFDVWKLRLPLIGTTFLKIEIGRFARTLGTLLTSAVPLINAVRIVQDIATNQIVSEGVSKIADGAKRGLGVARPMQDAGVFPPLAIHLVEVGEETGRLDAMLLQLADIYDKDVRTAIKSLTSVFEPAIILVMGVIVGTVVLSMLMAIFSINEIGF